MENLEQTIVRPKHSGSKKIFDNPLLEKLTRTHISIPIGIFLIIASGLLYYAFLYTSLSPALIPLLFICGFLFFTLLEYSAHRFLFHMVTNTEAKRKIQYNLHGVHHEYPKDKGRLAMPPPMSILLAFIFFCIFYSLLHTKVFGFLPGMLTGYALYLFVHYIVHAYAPPKNIFKVLWVNHAIHHYKDNSIVFGVSSPLWDYVFGTMPKK
ncbi:MAG TPA: sterol desaturase family protein [Cytophagaceae bacterium]|jgi:sterol desaturase/sphingolipid hydroxylase (fatty acid hydroxylase superfamily)